MSAGWVGDSRAVLGQWRRGEARARAGFESKWYLPLVEKTGRRRAEADAADAVAAVAAAAAGAGAGG